MAEPRPLRLAEIEARWPCVTLGGPSPRMRALAVHMVADTVARAQGLHALSEAAARELPRYRFEHFGGGDRYAYLDNRLDTYPKADLDIRRLERKGRLVWLSRIYCHHPEGLPHPVWTMRSQIMAAPKSNPVSHGDAAAASPGADYLLLLIGYRLAGAAPIRVARRRPPTVYIEAEVGGVRVAL